MWDKWKKRIARLFIKEVEEIEEIEQRPRDINMSHDERVHTRITHKYPKQTSFRFPVIPDDSSQSDIDNPVPERKQENMDQPAYERRWNTRENPLANQKSDKEKQHSTEQNREYDEPNAVDQKQKSDTQAAEKMPQQTDKKTAPDVEKESFKPTDVPSPIHGFRKREKIKEITEVPAYQRKQQTNQEIESASAETKDESQSDVQEEEMKSLTENAEPVEEEIFSSESPAKNQSGLEQETVELELNDTAPEGHHPANEEETSEVKQKEEEEEEVPTKPAKKKNPIHSSAKKAPEQKQPTHQSQPDDQQTDRPIPFNVMMSANDKRRYRERKRFSDRDRSVSPVKASIPHHLLNDPATDNSQDQLWVANQQELLEQTLKHFNVKAKVLRATQGPSVTRFEVQPEMGVKVSKIKNLSDDLKLNMAAKDIRIEAPIPGKNAVGVEIPNPEAQMVSLQEIFATEEFQNNASPLTVALGLTIEGSPATTTISQMPHGLIAGATGSGKSVCINTILISLIYKASHEDVKFMLIDPKMVELAPFNHIPHLVAPVITDVKAATQALKWAVKEMENRYEKFVEEGVRDIERYNEKMLKQNRPDEKLPYMVIVIDELADLMMVSPQDVEDAICRIAQKARACGMHLLLATQRPSVDVITGLIKANIPTRIAFSVSSQVDSRTIMDTNGAEKLLGKGDMLFSENGAGQSVRLQGAFVSDDEIERVTKYARSIAPAEYAFEQDDLLEQIAVDDEEEDSLLEEAIAFVVEQNSASTSLLQRHFKIGYNRAARLMDTMETKGIISQQNGSKPREVLVSDSPISGQH